jgi:hypothetical protein
MDDKEKIKLLEKQIELLEKVIELSKQAAPVTIYPWMPIPSSPSYPVYPATPTYPEWPQIWYTTTCTTGGAVSGNLGGRTDG